jgi:hypothetical protein
MPINKNIKNRTSDNFRKITRLDWAENLPTWHLQSLQFYLQEVHYFTFSRPSLMTGFCRAIRVYFVMDKNL